MAGKSKKNVSLRELIEGVHAGQKILTSDEEDTAVKLIRDKLLKSVINMIDNSDYAGSGAVMHMLSQTYKMIKTKVEIDLLRASNLSKGGQKDVIVTVPGFDMSDLTIGIIEDDEAN